MDTQSQKQMKAKEAQGLTPTTAKSSRVGLYKDEKSHYAVTIGRPVEEVFRFFRDFNHLPFFMKDIKDIKVISAKLSHWTVEVKMGVTVEWDAEIRAETPNEMIAWQSVDGAEVETQGTIWFRPAPAGMGTIVSLNLDYNLDYKVPGGKLTELVTKFTGEDPDSLAFTNLRRLKCYLETGEIATIHGQSSGREDDLEATQKH